MGGLVKSVTDEIKDSNGVYHKQGSIDDENFLIISDKLSNLESSLTSLASGLDYLKSIMGDLNMIANYLNTSTDSIEIFTHETFPNIVNERLLDINTAILNLKE